VIWLLTLWLAVDVPQGRGTGNDAVALAMFDKAPAWSDFLAGVKAQRERWTGNAARATVPADLADRMARAARGLKLLVVAQDWCVDSANTVPYIARLASSAQVPLRIVDRAAGEPLMKRFRSRDGRTVTPLVIVIRQDRVIGAWVERPAPLQHAFESIVTDPDARRLFEDRQAWYDADGGRTTMAEILAVAERPVR
jgi:Thioredoxin